MGFKMGHMDTHLSPDQGIGRHFIIFGRVTAVLTGCTLYALSCGSRAANIKS